MAAAYFENDFRATASFELFVRSLPQERSFLVAAGLEQALEYLESVRFEANDITYLRRQPVFAHVSDAFFDYLKDFRFTGEVWAIPEGTPVFSEEPLLRVTAPIIEAQIVEPFLLATLTFQTMIASKAARVVAAAKDATSSSLVRGALMDRKPECLPRVRRTSVVAPAVPTCKRASASVYPSSAHWRTP